MGRRDCSERIENEVKDRLDALNDLKRTAGYSKRIKHLLDFHDKYKKEYKEWIKKNQTKK
jgi:DNA repair ATPase RecN